MALGVVRADSPAEPRPYIVPVDSTNSVYYFQMVPGPSGWNLQDGEGGLYQSQDGSDKLLWETKGWYSFQVFVAKDLVHMVRMGPWNGGNMARADHLAVAFYASGVLITNYSTLDMVLDPNNVIASVSHYTWLDKIVGLEEYDPGNEFSEKTQFPLTFTLVTLPGERITFDAITGRIISRTIEND